MKQEILKYLGAGHIWAGSLRYYQTIDSTNTEAKRLADAGAPQGTVLVADHQTMGRGRMGNSFHSPANNGIYLSCILRPDSHAAELAHLTCCVAVAVCNAIEDATGFRPQVKWINDLIAGSKKLGGILTELSLDGQGHVRYAVVGIGINCNQTEDFPPALQPIATSLNQATNMPVNREALIAKIIDHLYKISQTLFTEKTSLMEQYRKDCITIGQEIQVIKSDERRCGTAIDLTDDGSLLVRYKDGTTTAVNSGEVHVRGLYGYC